MMTTPRFELANHDAKSAERPTLWRSSSQDELTFDQSEASFAAATLLPMHETFEEAVEISPREAAKRHTMGRDGLVAETVYLPTRSSVTIQNKANMHLLVLYEDGARRDGETSIEGLPPSGLRKLTNKLTFVPAGTRYREWHETGTALRVTYLYLDPARLQRAAQPGSAYVPKILFEDPVLWATAIKLKSVLDEGRHPGRVYLEALVNVLAHEVPHSGQEPARALPANRGSLASWQARAVIDHIEAHLSEQIPLATLAGIARLSTHHFCRSFKQSFGVPPHRYHLWRRTQKAKLLFSEGRISVTEVSIIVGYTSMSSFSDAFRKITGQTPSQFRRSLK
jgi:AraC family transcriptional regulator